MARNGFGPGMLSGMMLQWRAKFRTAATVVFALVALIAAATVFLGGTANAASLIGPGVDALEAYSVDKGFEEGAPSGDMWNLGTDAMSASWPVIPAYRGGEAPGMFVPERASEMVAVWNATMTVGKATDGGTTYVGYASGVSLGTEGSLDDTSFTYDGTDRTTWKGIFHHQARHGFQQAVFSSDKRIPEEMEFQAGDDRFPMSESCVLEARKNIHARPVDMSPGGAEQQNISVSLMTPSEPEPPPGPICG